MARKIEITSKEFLEAGATAAQIFELIEGGKWGKKGLTKRDISEISAGITSLMLRVLCPGINDDDIHADASEILSEKLGEAWRGFYEN